MTRQVLRTAPASAIMPSGMFSLPRQQTRSRPNGGCRLCLVDLEITDERHVIGKFHLRYLERGDVDLRAVEYVVQLSPGGAAGMGRFTVAVGIFQAGGRQEQLQFTVTPQHIEITGHDDRLGCLFHHFVQRFQLIMAVTEFDGEVYQEDDTLV